MRISAATERARERVRGGQAIRSSALDEGINPSTLFRLLARERGTVPQQASRAVIVGAGNLGREVAQWLRRDRPGAEIVFLDDGARGPSVIGTVESYQRQAGDQVLIAIANPKGRQAVGARIQAASFVSALATLGECSIGEGSLLLPHALVSANAALGECCVVNVHSSIGHDVRLGDYCTLSSHVDLCGHVTLGRRVFVGSGASVLPGVSIGDDATIGAGAIVMRDVPAGATVSGNPARVIA